MHVSDATHRDVHVLKVIDTLFCCFESFSGSHLRLNVIVLSNVTALDGLRTAGRLEEGRRPPELIQHGMLHGMADASSLNGCCAGVSGPPF